MNVHVQLTIPDTFEKQHKYIYLKHGTVDELNEILQREHGVPMGTANMLHRGHRVTDADLFDGSDIWVIPKLTRRTIDAYVTANGESKYDVINLQTGSLRELKAYLAEVYGAVKGYLIITRGKLIKNSLQFPFNERIMIVQTSLEKVEAAYAREEVDEPASAPAPAPMPVPMPVPAPMPVKPYVIPHVPSLPVILMNSATRKTTQINIPLRETTLKYLRKYLRLTYGETNYTAIYMGSPLADDVDLSEFLSVPEQIIILQQPLSAEAIAAERRRRHISLLIGTGHASTDVTLETGTVDELREYLKIHHNIPNAWLFINGSLLTPDDEIEHGMEIRVIKIKEAAAPSRPAQPVQPVVEPVTRASMYDNFQKYFETADISSNTVYYMVIGGYPRTRDMIMQQLFSPLITNIMYTDSDSESELPDIRVVFVDIITAAELANLIKYYQDFIGDITVNTHMPYGHQLVGVSEGRTVTVDIVNSVLPIMNSENKTSNMHALDPAMTLADYDTYLVDNIRAALATLSSFVDKCARHQSGIIAVNYAKHARTEDPDLDYLRELNGANFMLFDWFGYVKAGNCNRNVPDRSGGRLEQYVYYSNTPLVTSTGCAGIEAKSDSYLTAAYRRSGYISADGWIINAGSGSETIFILMDKLSGQLTVTDS